MYIPIWFLPDIFSVDTSLDLCFVRWDELTPCFEAIQLAIFRLPYKGLVEMT